MTAKQKAIATIIPPPVRETLRGTCKASEQRVERALPGGLVERKLTIQQAVNILGQHCEPQNAMIVDKVELVLTGPGK